MKLPWKKSDKTDSAADGSAAEAASSAPAEASTTPPETEKPLPKGYTPPKGRPTPTRREREIERGVLRDPNAHTPAQAAQRRKELKKSMSKEEWREYKAKERAEQRERNRIYSERMAAGEEKYLPQNDRGEEKRFARDWVDSRRFLSEWIMPAGFALLIILVIAQFSETFYVLSSVLGMALIFAFFAEGIILARRCNTAVKERFPGTTAAGWNMGFYAFSRASQPRRWRRPLPRVEVGDKI